MDQSSSQKEEGKRHATLENPCYCQCHSDGDEDECPKCKYAKPTPEIREREKEIRHILVKYGWPPEQLIEDLLSLLHQSTQEAVTETICPHCQGEFAIRNPKGYCDHLYYPENCDTCHRFNDYITEVIDHATQEAVEKIERFINKIDYGLSLSEREDWQKLNRSLTHEK